MLICGGLLLPPEISISPAIVLRMSIVATSPEEIWMETCGNGRGDVCLWMHVRNGGKGGGREAGKGA
jgi:hypothetical protein